MLMLSWVDRLPSLTLHALSAAIPHATLLLFSLLEILPFPRDFVRYEIKTGTVVCLDEEVGNGGGMKVKKLAMGGAGEEGHEEVGEGEEMDWEPELFEEERPIVNRPVVSLISVQETACEIQLSGHTIRYLAVINTNHHTHRSSPTRQEETLQHQTQRYES